jgi:hypothetical protein
MKLILNLIFTILLVKSSLAQILAGQTGSDIYFKDFVPDTTFAFGPSWSASTGIDINNDGILDFRLESSHAHSPGGTFDALKIVCLDSNQVIIDSINGYADTINSGKIIGPSALWSNSGFNNYMEYNYNSSLGSDTYFGFWRYVSDSYLGVRCVSESDTSYGYIHVHTGHSHGSYRIKDHGFKMEVASVSEQAINKFKIYPNPFSDKLYLATFSNEFYLFSLFDIQSRMIFKTEVKGHIEINTQSLTEGLYIYEIEDNTKKIIRGKLIRRLIN